MSKLSDKMQEAYEVIKKHEKIIRWGECYWTYPECPRDARNVPNWICQTSTLRALEKRKLIILDENQNVATMK